MIRQALASRRHNLCMWLLLPFLEHVFKHPLQRSPLTNLLDNHQYQECHRYGRATDNNNEQSITSFLKRASLEPASLTKIVRPIAPKPTKL
jgi:hypothetical protein